MKTDGGRSSMTEKKTCRKFEQNKDALWVDDREEEEDVQLNEMMKNLSESSKKETFGCV